MINKAQLLKGLLEGCILKIIAEGETYGYQLTSNLNEAGFADLNEGSVYPVLVRLSRKNYVASKTKISPLGPRRKYFTITEEGRQFLSEFRIVWKEISTVVDGIMKEGVMNER